jgi:EmrB/QacA subfamily drug resistance transporter
VSRSRIVLVTAGVMLALFVSAVESTVVATAMPTIIGQLGGLQIYSWVFSAYMLTSTATVPIYGKLSDLYGRRSIFLFSMILFLAGSFLSGHSADMTELIVFRALQGLGAGGLIPLAFIIIGDLFSFQQRARMQGLFSGVWGVSSVIGPLLGGFLVDQISWHWVFYVNIAPGLLSALLVALAWRERPVQRPASAIPIDFAGTALLCAAAVALMLALMDLGSPLALALLALTVALFAGLLWVERRAPDPILPLPLFGSRLFAVACLQGLMAGWAMFGGTSFVPLFAQGVLGTSATLAGATLTPETLSWTLASIVGSRLLLRFGYRAIALAGMAALVAGSLFMAQLNPQSSLAGLMISFAVMGAGMGLSFPAFLIAVQSDVPRQVLGTATATLQFSRSIGGTIGVSVMGAVLSWQLAAGLLAAGIDPATAPISQLVDPLTGAAAPSGVLNDALKLALSGGIRSVFVVALVAAVVALGATALAPRERISGVVTNKEW